MFTKSIPSLFTLGNLVLGMASIILVFQERVELAAIMVIVAMLLDGLDGRVARALNVTSEFGKELDSLSDVISFGVAPAFIVYAVAYQDYNAVVACTATAIFPICGALRLARFNVVASTPGYFIGLPIPAAGGLLATMALFSAGINATALIVVEIGLSALMVSNIKYPSFKKITIPRKAVWITPIIVVIAVVLAVMIPGLLSKLLFAPLVLYALLGIKKNVRRVARRRKRRELEEKTKLNDL